MFKKILVAVDGSADAREAVRYAGILAGIEQAKVIVVHAFDPIPAYLGEPHESRATSERVKQGHVVAQEAADALEQAGFTVSLEVLEGPAAEAILKVAEVRQPDLIVMGTRGRGNLTSLILSSVSHRVLAHTRIPVLVVQAPDKQAD